MFDKIEIVFALFLRVFFFFFPSFFFLLFLLLSPFPHPSSVCEPQTLLLLWMFVSIWNWFIWTRWLDPRVSFFFSFLCDKRNALPHFFHVQIFFLFFSPPSPPWIIKFIKNQWFSRLLSPPIPPLLFSVPSSQHMPFLAFPHFNFLFFFFFWKKKKYDVPFSSWAGGVCWCTI